MVVPSGEAEASASAPPEALGWAEGWLAVPPPHPARRLTDSTPLRSRESVFFMVHFSFLQFTQNRAQKNALESTSRTRAFRFVVPPCFTPASRQGPYGVRTYSCALTGAPVAAYTGKPVVGAPLRDHVQQDLPYPLAPDRALCDVSSCLLFSSLRLRGVIQFRLGCE